LAVRGRPGVSVGHDLRTLPVTSTQRRQRSLPGFTSTASPPGPFFEWDGRS
jgi:hypothetical protein